MKFQESQPDRNRRSDEYDTLWDDWLQFWATRKGVGIAVGAVLVVSGLLLFGNLGQLGIWEPWEANEILVAQEYQSRPAPPSPAELDPKEPSYNWAVPTKDREPIHRSLLKTWLVGWSLGSTSVDDGQPEVGTLEWAARAPFAFAVLILALVGFFWLRDVFDTWSALLGTVAFVSAPALYVGVHTVSAETLFVVTTSAAIIAFAKLVYAEGPLRYLWGGLFGIGLALSFLDQRFFGLLVPLTTITAFGLTQLPYRRVLEVAEDRESSIGLFESVSCGLTLAVAVGVAVWGFSTGSGGPDGELLSPPIAQLLTVFLPLLVLLAGLFLAWKTRVVRALRSPAGLLGLGVLAAAVIPVLEAYANANPTLVERGHIVGSIPVLDFVLQNELFGSGPSGNHPHFAMWFRQLGFSLVPWVAFVPLALGYLAESTRLTDEKGAIRKGLLDERESIRRLLLVWSFVGVVVVAAGSAYGHYYVPVYYPLLVGVGLMLGDSEFWRRARLDSLVQYFMGFAVIVVVLMVAKDLERFPPRLLEPYLMFERDLGLPDDFSYGELIDRLKYLWILVGATFFFGLASRVLHDKYRDAFLPAFVFLLVAGFPATWGHANVVLDAGSFGLGGAFNPPMALLQIVWAVAVVAIPFVLLSTKVGETDEYLTNCIEMAWFAGLIATFAFAFFFGGDPALMGPVSLVTSPAEWFATFQAFGREVVFSPGKLVNLFAVTLLIGAWLVRGSNVFPEWFGRRWSNLQELLADEGSPLRERILEKERFRRRSGFFPSVARFFETPQTFAAVLTITFVASGGVFLYDILPRLGNHLSQRGIFETYTRVADDAKLYRLRVSTNETSVYLRQVPRLGSTSEFIQKFDQAERFFAVVPRDQLSSLNTRVRERHDRDIPVLDASSNQILLVSNQLAEDETSQNFIADSIVDNLSAIKRKDTYHPVTFGHKGRQKHPVYDNRLKLLGYTLDRPGDPPTYSWSEEAVLTTYFRVMKPVPTNQQIFLHVDYPNSRIHGDHYPMGGDFPTSDWPEGRVVRDRYRLKIDPYSSTGNYTLFFGFYRAGRRMPVTPPTAHDGDNRVPMGKIEVSGF